MRHQNRRDAERGAALLEFTVGAFVFVAAVFAVVEFGRLLWTHNALTDAARRGARYAVNQPADASARSMAQRMAVYGTTDDGAARPLVNGLAPSNVRVEHSTDYDVGQGTVTVSIENYEFGFVVPLLRTKILMPAYRTTLTGESAGRVPPNVS